MDMFPLRVRNSIKPLRMVLISGELFHRMSHSSVQTFVWLVFVCIMNSSLVNTYDFYSQKSDTWTTSTVIISFTNPVTGNSSTETHEESGRYFDPGPRDPGPVIKDARGVLVHRRGVLSQGCVPYNHKLSSEEQQQGFRQWIALVKKGNCTDTEKLLLAEKYNATGVVLYDNKPGDELYTIENSGNIPAILITMSFGQHIAALVDNGTTVELLFEVGTKVIEKDIKIKKSSVLFVSVSFIVLMMISLAWLVFYYIQRFRYAQARDRTQKRLSRAAKKAIAKLPSKHIKEGDDILLDRDFCPVCLEAYKISELVRVLPCKHFYHKLCVDQWLIEHRTCPMCKLNILKALGYGNQLTMRASEEALYVFELGQIIFNSTIDGDDPNRGSNFPWPASTQQAVRVMAVTEDAQSEDSHSDESRNGSSSSEGILPPVTTTVELHRNCPSPISSETPCLGPTTV